MLELIISGIDISEWVSKFTVNSAAANGSEKFRNWDGKTVGGDDGDIISLDIKLAKVPTENARKLSSALNGEFAVSYTSPAPVSTDFKKVKYNAESRTKGLTWDISLSLESAAPVGGSCL